MNEQELEQIEARAAKATPGPWEVDNDLSVYTKDGGHGTPWTLFDTVGNEGEDNPNADFIAHAREDIPALIAEVRRLTAELTRLTDALALYQANEKRAIKSLNLIASAVYGAYIFEGDTYAHTSTVEALRQVAKEALNGNGGGEG